MSLPPASRPRRISPGDTVGVVAPSGAVDPERLARGVSVLEDLGFRVRLGRAVGARRGYLAGSDAERLADLQAMLGDPSVGAVFCARGGYGSQRVVPRLDWTALRRVPKLVMGYSDVTALLAAVVRHLGTAVHGPMVATDLAQGLAAPSLEHLRRLLGEPDYRWALDASVCVRPGAVDGPLVGGCLSVIASTIGTANALDARGAVLFLEDVNEPAYRLDRLLLQLRQSGVLDGVAGIVFGTLDGCASHDGVDPLDVVREHFADADVPVAAGLAAGHTGVPSAGAVVNMALPMGVRVRLDATSGRLAALEATVS